LFYQKKWLFEAPPVRKSLRKNESFYSSKLPKQVQAKPIKSVKIKVKVESLLPKAAPALQKVAEEESRSSNTETMSIK